MNKIRNGLAVIGAAALAIGGGLAAWADYTAQQPIPGNKTFASFVLSMIDYPAFVLCDPVAGKTQCASVTAGGAVKTDASATTQPVSGTVTANAGTNLNTSALATSTNIATLNTTMGTPFQAGGSIGNTAFIANAGTNLNTSALATSANLTSGTANLGTFNSKSIYNTVAASQTAQALTGGGGGATGDYLSHCVVFPTSTSPGVVTILDNSTAIFPFPGGATSTSNLVPFSIPIGAKSTSGAWKVTTGTNVSVTCVGGFT